MKIGLNTDGVGHLSLQQTLDFAAELGLDAVEFATGAWSSAPHLDLIALRQDPSARRALLADTAERGLSISALTCSGNPLDPGPSGRDHDRVTRDTIALAGELGVDRVVMMSGCPGGPGDANPNWIVVSWPPEATRNLEWQWTEVVIPYWQELVDYAQRQSVSKLCLEMHAQQVVYNVPTVLRLREAVGPVVGANLDPSHLMWMGADPLAAVEALGDAIYYVHAKDTRLEPAHRLTSRLETLSLFTDARDERAWNYVTLGHGHDEQYWREFCAALDRVGYDGVLSIEHEDPALDPLDAIRDSVALLRRAGEPLART